MEWIVYIVSSQSFAMCLCLQYGIFQYSLYSEVMNILALLIEEKPTLLYLATDQMVKNADLSESNTNENIKPRGNSPSSISTEGDNWVKVEKELKNDAIEKVLIGICMYYTFKQIP